MGFGRPRERGLPLDCMRGLSFPHRRRRMFRQDYDDLQVFGPLARKNARRADDCDEWGRVSPMWLRTTGALRDNNPSAGLHLAPENLANGSPVSVARGGASAANETRARVLAWTREAMLRWLRNSGRSSGKTDMKITLRPYSKDKDRWQVDIRLMNLNNPNRELRRRLVAPAGCSRRQARVWAEQRAAALLVELMGETHTEVDCLAPRKEVRRSRAKPMTFGEFYRMRFQPEPVELLKPATRNYYRRVWGLHIEPLLGDLPLVALDDDRLSSYRAALRHRLAASCKSGVASSEVDRISCGIHR